MMDLHIHSYYSDGTDSPESVVSQAKAIGLSTMAITDHDGVDGISEALAAGEKLGISIIPGIEISVTNEGGNMHILGYRMDLENEDFQRSVETMRRNRADRNRRLIKAFEEIGITITEAEVRAFAKSDYIGKPQMALVLKSRGYIREVREAFDGEGFFRAEPLRQIRRVKYSPEEGIKIILAAGGIPVLAHPYTLKLSKESLERKVIQLAGYGLKGVECYYSQHDPLMTSEYLKLAKKHGLIVTVGSDYHGREIDPDIKIGQGRNGNLEHVKIKLSL